MKILALNFNQHGIGTYRRTFHFSRELARHGHDVTMFTVSRTSKFRAHTYYKRDWTGEHASPLGEGPWVRLVEGPALGHKWIPGWGSGPLDIGMRLGQILTGGFDLVYGFEYHPNVSWPVYLTQAFSRYKFCSDWCDWFAGSSNKFRGKKWAHRIDRFLEERIRYRARKVTVTSRVLRDRALGMGIPAERVVQIPEAAATDYIYPQDRRKVREQLGLPLDVPLIAVVRNGDMEREIGVLELLRRKNPRAMLLMIGSIPQPAERAIARFGLEDRVIRAGWVSDEDYPRYLASADVCFCPLVDSLNDQARWPAKILDFLAAGRATVTTPVGEAEPLFREQGVGVLAGHSSEELAEALAGLLEDPVRRAELETTSRRVMVDQWAWKVRGDLIERTVTA
jgi:glycosyltransferase involved in cell wall biosynthesis